MLLALPPSDDGGQTNTETKSGSAPQTKSNHGRLGQYACAATGRKDAKPRVTSDARRLRDRGRDKRGRASGAFW